MIGADRVQIRKQLCPHRSVTINTVEAWGTAHTYTFRDYCEFCGPLRDQIFRPRDAG